MRFEKCHTKGLSAFMKAGFRALAFTNRQLSRMERVLGSVALCALDARALRGLTTVLYGCNGGYTNETLFDWEKAWFDANLPQKTGKVLLGGAGPGRELRHLMKLGHIVVAFDPVPSFLDQARKLVEHAPGPVILAGAYEDLAEPGTDAARQFSAEVEAQAPYDAVLLGWASFTHVVTAYHRLELLKVCRRLCPYGPLLASFWMRPDSEPLESERATRLGRRIGALLARSRPSCTEPGDVIRGHCGFCHFFTPSELHELARGAGYEVRRLESGHGTYPHMTLWPKENSGSSCDQR